jgi:hypothetical protein
MRVERIPLLWNSLNSKRRAVMKTDLVLTMDEYLNACSIARRVNPPASDARHVPIAVQEDAEVHKEHGCRCDRWGHPCPDCLENREPQLCAAADELRQ